MPRIADTTNAETKFLRSLAKNPLGPPPEAWPNPTILRRWLKRPTFRRALDSLVQTHRFTADLHLAAASSHAAHTLDRSLQQKPDAPLTPPMVTNLLRLLNLSHVRQRFTPTPSPAPEPPAKESPHPPIGSHLSPEEFERLLQIMEADQAPSNPNQ